MAPLWLQLTLPASEILGAGLLIRRIPTQRYRALIGFLMLNAGLHTWSAVPNQGWNVSTYGAIPGMAAAILATVEACRRARTTWNRTEARSMTVWAGGSVALATVAVWSAAGLSPLTSWYVARQYSHLSLAVVLWALIGRSLRAPVLEHPRDRAYRWGMAPWMSVLTVGSSFTPGGIGYAIVHPGPLWWGTVQTAVLAALVGVVIWLCVQMGARGPSRRAVSRSCVVRRGFEVHRKTAA